MCVEQTKRPYLRKNKQDKGETVNYVCAIHQDIFKYALKKYILLLKDLMKVRKKDKGIEFVKNLREVIFKSMSPRLNESAQIADLIWEVSFFGVGFDTGDETCSELSITFVEEFWVCSEDAGSEWAVKTPNRSDSSELFRGTATKGSKIFAVSNLDDSLFLVNTLGLDAAKKSMFWLTALLKSDWQAKKSTFPCNNMYKHTESSPKRVMYKNYCPNICKGKPTFYFCIKFVERIGFQLENIKEIKFLSDKNR